jgi:hypothetical protein
LIQYSYQLLCVITVVITNCRTRMFDDIMLCGLKYVLNRNQYTSKLRFTNFIKLFKVCTFLASIFCSNKTKTMPTSKKTHGRSHTIRMLSLIDSSSITSLYLNNQNIRVHSGCTLRKASSSPLCLHPSHSSR